MDISVATRRHKPLSEYEDGMNREPCTGKFSLARITVTDADWTTEPPRA